MKKTRKQIYVIARQRKIVKSLSRIRAVQTMIK